MYVWSLGGKDPLEKKMATRFNILAWEIPSAEETRGLQWMVLQRIGLDWACTHLRPFFSSWKSETHRTSSQHCLSGFLWDALYQNSSGLADITSHPIHEPGLSSSFFVSCSLSVTSLKVRHWWNRVIKESGTPVHVTYLCSLELIGSDPELLFSWYDGWIFSPPLSPCRTCN